MTIIFDDPNQYHFEISTLRGDTDTVISCKIAAWGMLGRLIAYDDN